VSRPEQSPVASDDPVVTLVTDGAVSHPAHLIMSELGVHRVGSSSDAQWQITQPEIAAHHFTIERGSKHCLLQPIEAVSLNGREVSQPVQLVNGDEISAGALMFRYACPADGHFPFLRIADTFWIMAGVPDKWMFSSGSGLFRRLEDDFVENIFLSQDVVSGEPLDDYIKNQCTSLSEVTEAFSTQALNAPTMYRSDASALRRHEFSIERKRVRQYQYFVLKNQEVGIASWTIPPADAQHKDDSELLFEHLKYLYFG
jgi:hypothetical protein